MEIAALLLDKLADAGGEVEMLCHQAPKRHGDCLVAVKVLSAANN